RRQERQELPRIGVAALRRTRRRSARAGSGGAQTIGAVVQFLGAWPGVPVHRRGRPPPGLGKAGDRFLPSSALAPGDAQNRQPASGRLAERRVGTNEGVSCEASGEPQEVCEEIAVEKDFFARSIGSGARADDLEDENPVTKAVVISAGRRELSRSAVRKR